MSRPVVGLVCARETIDTVPYAAVRELYVDALEQVSGVAVVLLAGRSAQALHVLDRLDGLVLGGHQSNIDAARYAGAAAPGPFDPGRDASALRLIPEAVRSGLPVLGICRGLQEINVAFGGTLRDLRATPLGAGHREDESLPRDRQYLPVHEVRLTPGGLLRAALGADTVAVNSLHQQAIDRLGDGLTVEAVAADGVVEAVSRAGHGGGSGFCLGVQWHPEWYARSDPNAHAVFAAFGEAAAGSGASAVPASVPAGGSLGESRRVA